MVPYPKRLIEVDLPIREISAHARREKSIRHGHISTLHIWWARRPLAACRAVLCASLWPDPADDACPQGFRDAAAVAICYFADQVQHDEKLAVLCKNHWSRWIRTNPTSLRSSDPACWADMRYALLDFIADFANWDASTLPVFLDMARLLTQAAHMSLNGMWPEEPCLAPNGNLSEAFSSLEVQIKDFPRPLVVDPFAGGGAIPLEALRVGADVFASDLNPVAVLLNKVVLEYIPKYGNTRIESKDVEGNPIVFNGLAEAMQYWGNWIKEQALKDLVMFYPKDSDNAITVAYLWARTIICEGPACGAEIPLLRNLQLTRKGRLWCVDLTAQDKYIETLVRQGSSIGSPTAKNGSATCPCCGYTTSANSVRMQLSLKRGGSRSARLFAVYIEKDGIRSFRNPTEADLEAFEAAGKMLDENSLPKEKINPIRPYANSRGLSAVTRIGIEDYSDLYNPRQAFLLSYFQNRVLEISFPDENKDFERVIATCLHFAVSRFIFQNCTLARWDASRSNIAGAFGKQALQVVWDFAEVNPLSDGSGSWMNALNWVIDVIKANSILKGESTIALATAQSKVLPDETVQAFFTDPPYFAAIPYADLSNVFYVWERKLIEKYYPDIFVQGLVNQQDEIIVTNANIGANGQQKTPLYFHQEMTKALTNARISLQSNSIGVIVFADSGTESWEAIIGSIINAGWIVTSSWPIDTELQNRTQAQDAASLQSSIHIICRPREDSNGMLVSSIGDWREVLSELPSRIHSWLPRLANEGIVGADAIFACLGPALEIFSRYSRVEKASGEVVTLKEYLEVVWAAVSREAMSVIFEGADATGFEEDARLTAMWLWTLSGNKPETQSDGNENADTGETDEETPIKANGSGSHYALEFDTARKIAQGLGAHLDRLNSLVEVKGDKARLLSVSERAGSLFGREENPLQDARKKTASLQPSLFSLMVTADGSSAEDEWQEDRIPAGQTTLDQIHQAMLLFGAGRSAVLKRFLVDDGIGKAERFWRLAQALSALYPSNSEEKRWVDGVLAKKKGFGF